MVKSFFVFTLILLFSAPSFAAEKYLRIDDYIPAGPPVDAEGIADTAITTHNTDTSAHPTLVGPNIQGKVLRSGTAVNDDDCSGEQGYWWWDSTDSAFEWCNADTGAPTTIGGSESDPIVGAITGIPKANGAGAISAAITDTDYASAIVNHANLHAWVVGATSVLTLNTPIVLDEATGSEDALALFYQTNKLTSGDDSGLRISLRDTASPGTSYLFRAGVNTDGTIGTHTDAFYVRNNGYAHVQYGIRSTSDNVAITIGDSQYKAGASGRTSVEIGASIFTNTTGSTYSVKILPIYNQVSGNAANTDLFINRTETAVGSGAQKFLSMGKGGGSYVEYQGWTNIGVNTFFVGANVVSGDTIAATGPMFHVTGVTTINTITVPLGCTAGCQITIIPDAIFATGVTGNIAIASTSVVSKALVMSYDAGTSKWYPSY